MEQNRLDCCVVRDLLPAYLEELTEPETSAQVAAHLEGCEDCKRLEADLRSQVPVEKVPKKALNFLKRVKRTRLLAAALTLMLTLWCMWWLYDAEFHYPNTEAGRLSAVTDYVVSPPDSPRQHIREGDTLWVVGWQTVGKHLFIAYGSDSVDNVHGILHLVRGINGKYETLDASLDPFPYTAGVWGESLSPKKSDLELFALAGEGCREIFSAQVEFYVYNEDAGRYGSVTKTYDIPEPNFLWLIDRGEMLEELGRDRESSADFFVREIRFLDKNGSDVTDQYQDDTVRQDWAGAKGSAETILLYFYLGGIALLGFIIIRYFLRKD